MSELALLSKFYKSDEHLILDIHRNTRTVFIPCTTVLGSTVILETVFSELLSGHSSSFVI